MRKIYLAAVLLRCACNHFDTRSNQKKGEELARHFLDSALSGQGDYKTIVFGKIDTIFDTTASKKHQVKGWSLYASYQGNDAYGAYEIHKVSVAFDPGFTRVLSVNKYGSTGK